MAAALGAAATALFTTKSGKKIQKDIKKMAGQVYREAMPQLKKLKNVGKAEFEKVMAVGVSRYAAAQKMTAAEKAKLMKEAKGAWGKIKKHI